MGLSGDSKTTSSTLYEGLGVRSVAEGDAEGSDTLGGDASGTGAAAVGEYTGFAKLNVFSASAGTRYSISYFRSANTTCRKFLNTQRRSIIIPLQRTC